MALPEGKKSPITDPKEHHFKKKFSELQGTQLDG
jgi:hypothetical protein